MNSISASYLAGRKLESWMMSVDSGVWAFTHFPLLVQLSWSLWQSSCKALTLCESLIPRSLEVPMGWCSPLGELTGAVVDTGQRSPEAVPSDETHMAMAWSIKYRAQGKS